MTMGPAGESPPTGEDDGANFADVLNSLTLDSGRVRRKPKKTRDKQAGAGARTETGHRAPAPAPRSSPSPRGEGTAPGPQPAPYRPSPPGEPAQGEPTGFTEPPPGSGLFEPSMSNGGPADWSQWVEDDWSPVEEASVVRPYALTGGRTKANLALELETLISVSDTASEQDLTTVQFEHRSIMEECRKPRSVAEIAALLRVPLGVARVLISDAADAGLITVHTTMSGDEDAEAHLMLMERVLSGLRRL